MLGPPRFARSVIRSSASLSYGDAQAVIDDADRGDGLALGLRQLDHLAQQLRQRRREAGAFMLNGGDAKVNRAADNSLELTNQAGLRVNELIEEWMVLANAAVATQIVGAFPETALLRRHAPPTEDSLQWLQLALEQRGLSLDGTSAASLGQSLDSLMTTTAADPPFGELLKHLVTRLLPPALYVRAGTVAPTEHRHTGLALPLYTHFTSPIRRYADQLVHRMLGASLGWPGYAINAEEEHDHGKLDALALTLNERKGAAKQAERDSLGLYTLSYFREQARRPTRRTALAVLTMRTALTMPTMRTTLTMPSSLAKVEKHGEGPTVDAFVVGLQENGVKLHLPTYVMDEFAFVCDNSQANPFSLEEEGRVLRADDVTLRMLDRVKVRIGIDDSRIHARLKLDIVEPTLPTPQAP